MKNRKKSTSGAFETIFWLLDQMALKNSVLAEEIISNNNRIEYGWATLFKQHQLQPIILYTFRNAAVMMQDDSGTF